MLFLFNMIVLCSACFFLLGHIFFGVNIISAGIQSVPITSSLIEFTHERTLDQSVCGNSICWCCRAAAAVPVLCHQPAYLIAITVEI